MLAEILGGFAGVVTGLLAVLPIALACLLVRAPRSLRAVAIVIGVATAAVEAAASGAAAAASAALGGALGGLLLAEIWLVLILPALRLGWRLLAAGLHLILHLCRVVLGQGAARTRDPD